MSSINTNAGAMTALQTLKATNKSLETTQGRISTGFAVSEASHNAAYWSIATTMRSDNNAMSTVRDALGLGAAQVDIAYTAMDAVKDTLDTMKKKLVAASQPDIDKEKIQEEIVQLQNDLQTYAKSATFSGGNWLDVDSAATQKVVASFIRDSSGGITLGTIDVNTAKTALFNSDPLSQTGGLLQNVEAKSNIAALGNLAVDPESVVEALYDTTTPVAAETELTGFAEVDLYEGDTFSFDVTYGTTKHTITIAGTGIEADGDTPTTLDAAALATAINTAFSATFTVTDASGTLTVTAPAAAADGSEDGNTISFANFEATTTKEIDITDIDITDPNAHLGGLLSAVDNALSAVTTAASDLGAIKTRIGSQSDFVGKIMDAVSRGVGQLVDADMEAESARLQALQVQQQLGIQALSIANSNTQNILSLFR